MKRMRKAYWKYHKEHGYWYKNTPKSENVIYLQSPETIVRKKWAVRSERRTRRSPSGAGVYRFFKSKRAAMKFIKRRTGWRR